MKFRFLIILIIVISFIVFVNIYNEEEDLYLIQTSIKQKNEYINNFYVYSTKKGIIRAENFTDLGDVSYTYHDKNNVFYMGPGGLYSLNVNDYQLKKMSDKDINIVRSYGEHIYYYNNIGFVENGYSGEICSYDECIAVNIHVDDFIVNKNEISILGDGKILVYVNNEFSSEIDLSGVSYLNRIISLNGKAYLVCQNGLRQISNLGNIYQLGDLISFNQKIGDPNVKIIETSNGNTIFYDDSNLSIYDFLASFNLNKIYESDRKHRFSNSNFNDEYLFYYIENNNIEVKYTGDFKNFEKKRLSHLLLISNEVVYSVYKIK